MFKVKEKTVEKYKKNSENAKALVTSGIEYPMLILNICEQRSRGHRKEFRTLFQFLLMAYLNMLQVYKIKIFVNSNNLNIHYVN